MRGSVCNEFSAAKSVSDALPKCSAQSEEEAIEFVRNYIQTCIDSGESDCRDMGGRAHLGITASGFSWVVAPI